jgi:hypothetical protein
MMQSNTAAMLQFTAQMPQGRPVEVVAAVQNHVVLASCKLSPIGCTGQRGLLSEGLPCCCNQQ